RGDDLLGDRDLLAVNRYGPNAEIWSLMRHSGMGQELHRRCGASNERGILDKRPRLGKHTAEKFGHAANRGEYVALCLVRAVERFHRLMLEDLVNDAAISGRRSVLPLLQARIA